MRRFWQNIWKKEEGMGTVEIVIIIAVLVGVALLFRGQITNFVSAATAKVFDTKIIDESIAPSTGGGTSTP
ncbi:MAG TPA: Flp1 family type IVb pilin [Peptococcaceae bacterium]|jgi:hypothetical protein|nr:hypothetical protein [Clostridia bacterium]HOB81406.1 Flp1 family type IVb pilin [Peptococcaceae bacterium]HPZ72195.1 Flp1 family type IVb pilin [Peptococcaceae bacterium]HQD53457.1 Flp1 family type IVb pilin [Peptococcaceae bacterium]